MGKTAVQLNMLVAFVSCVLWAVSYGLEDWVNKKYFILLGFPVTVQMSLQNVRINLDACPSNFPGIKQACRALANGPFDQWYPLASVRQTFCSISGAVQAVSFNTFGGTACDQLAAFWGISIAVMVAGGINMICVISGAYLHYRYYTKGEETGSYRKKTWRNATLVQIVGSALANFMVALYGVWTVVTFNKDLFNSGGIAGAVGNAVISDDPTAPPVGTAYFLATTGSLLQLVACYACYNNRQDKGDSSSSYDSSDDSSDTDDEDSVQKPIPYATGYNYGVMPPTMVGPPMMNAPPGGVPVSYAAGPVRRF